MNDDIKAHLIDGTLTAAPLSAALTAARGDAALAAELSGQWQLHAAMQVLLGDDAANRRCAGMALRRLRGTPAIRHGSPRAMLARFQQNRIAIMSAAAAVLLSGILTERIVRPVALTSRPLDKTISGTDKGRRPAE